MAIRIPLSMLAASLLAAASSANAAQLYKWKDAGGVTHYSDAPPAKGRFQAREVATPVATTAPAPAAAPGASTAPSPDANCTVAQTNLSRLTAGGDIGIDADRDGKPDAPLGAAERVKQIQFAQQNIGRFCKPAAPAP